MVQSRLGDQEKRVLRHTALRIIVPSAEQQRDAPGSTSLRALARNRCRTSSAFAAASCRFETPQCQQQQPRHHGDDNTNTNITNNATNAENTNSTDSTDNNNNNNNSNNSNSNNSNNTNNNNNNNNNNNFQLNAARACSAHSGHWT